MRWLELTVEADAEAVDAVSEILGRVTSDGGTAVRPTRVVHDPADELVAREDATAPYVVTGHIADGPAAAGAVEATQRALWHLQAFGLRPMSALRVSVVDDDWTDAWRAHYAPQRIGRVVVVPSWVSEPLASEEVAVRLDPGMAFGTGLHPTTRGCLQLLQAIRPMPLRALDVGTGSGILALAALQLGAAHVDALDTDRVAVDASRRNAARNGMEGRLAIRHGTLDANAARPYPLVMANLVAALLVELAPRLASHTAPGGALVAGGIVAERRGEVLTALAAEGLTVVTEINDGEWASLRLVRG